MPPSCNPQRGLVGRGKGNTLTKTYLLSLEASLSLHTLLCPAKEISSKHSQSLNTVSSLKSQTYLQLFLQLYKVFFIAPAFRQVYYQQLLTSCIGGTLQFLFIPLLLCGVLFCRVDWLLALKSRFNPLPWLE